jgi:hypothetical protein
MTFLRSSCWLFLVTAFCLTDVHSAASADCGWLGQQIGICKAVDDLDKRLEDITKTVAKLGDDTLKAIPGERWLRIIDDLNSGDAVARGKAQAYLSSVAGVKILNASDIANYALSVGFDYDESKTFNAHVHTFEAPDPLLLETYLRFGPQLDRPTKFMFSAINRDEVRRRLMVIADRAVLGFTGPYEPIRLHEKPSECKVAGDAYCAKFSFNDPIGRTEVVVNNQSTQASFDYTTDDLKAGPPAFNTRRAAIQTALADLVLDAISYREERNNSKEMSLDWPILTKRKFAVIFIDKETYEQQPDFTIKMRVNKRDNPDENLAGMPTFVVKKKHFDPAADNRALIGRNKEQLYWTARDMTGDIGQTLLQLNSMDELRIAIDKFNRRRAEK